MSAPTKKPELSAAEIIERHGARGENVSDAPMGPAGRIERARESYYFAPIAAAERRLWAAILVDAVSICLGQTVVPKDERLAARRWIEARGKAVGGFLWCCHLLGLEEDAIIQRIESSGRRVSMLDGGKRPVFGYSRPRRYAPVAAGGGTTRPLSAFGPALRRH